MKPLLYDEINQAKMNEVFREKGWSPLYTASPRSRIALIGQAPGRIAQETNKTWNDASGKLLRQWLGVTDEQFYNPDLFAIIPMDFYYPGKGEHGDLPPRKEFAATWHPKLLARMPDIRLTILIGIYSQKYYLAENAKQNLTENVKNFKSYLPDYFPLVHPSPINIFWRKRNPWFETDVVPALQAVVKTVLA
ncbi:uracil-DNA glycosylase family protein [Treponema parvum]|uniref:Uracil-DNA glycosylase family protein n=1 Tax=Treponema parvum TaxID=138851 RepID=A0A975EXW1_9SPIR|nr:uracil-DNA glycosylase family protein [Treponema parvum]QTQ10999.1 uracil-DNA glycosylase family protein [Treponema parvum]